MMKKWKVSSIAEALGVTEDSVYGFMKNRGISAKGGMDLTQIAEYISAPKQKKRIFGADPDEVAEIRHLLPYIMCLPGNASCKDCRHASKGDGYMICLERGELITDMTNCCAEYGVQS